MRARREGGAVGRSACAQAADEHRPARRIGRGEAQEHVGAARRAHGCTDAVNVVHNAARCGHFDGSALRHEAVLHVDTDMREALGADIFEHVTHAAACCGERIEDGVVIDGMRHGGHPFLIGDAATASRQGPARKPSGFGRRNGQTSAPGSGPKGRTLRSTPSDGAASAGQPLAARKAWRTSSACCSMP